MIVLKYGFEFGNDHSCLTSVNEEAINLFGGYIVNNDSITIDHSLALRLIALCEEYQSSFNWYSPQDPSPWEQEQKDSFFYRAKQAYYDLVAQLGNNYNVLFDVFIPQ